VYLPFSNEVDWSEAKENVTSRDVPALLFICRQIHAEAKGVYLFHPKTRFPVNLNPQTVTAISELLDEIGSENCKTIHHLTLRFVVLSLAIAFAKLDILDDHIEASDRTFSLLPAPQFHSELAEAQWWKDQLETDIVLRIKRRNISKSSYKGKVIGRKESENKINWVYNHFNDSVWK